MLSGRKFYISELIIAIWTQENLIFHFKLNLQKLLLQTYKSSSKSFFTMKIPTKRILIQHVLPVNFDQSVIVIQTATSQFGIIIRPILAEFKIAEGLCDNHILGRAFVVMSKPTQSNLQLIRKQQKMQFKQENKHTMVPIVTTNHPVLKNLNSVQS